MVKAKGPRAEVEARRVGTSELKLSLADMISHCAGKSGKRLVSSSSLRNITHDYR